MSEWGSYEIDDVFWDEPRVTDDHIVPDPEDERESAWTVKGERCEILNAVARSSEQKTLGSKNVLPGEKEAILSCPSTKEEPLPQILDMDMWCDPQYEDLATAYNSVHADAGMGIKAGKEGEIGDCYKDVKLGSADNDLIIGGCKEDPLLEDSNAALMNNSCHFSLTDICPLEGDLIFFGNEHQDKESCSLMDYGWANIGNFEDVDRLLSDDCSRNCESMFRHTMNSSADELRWPSSSSDCVRDFPSRIVQHGRATSSPEIRALKAKSQEYEVKMEFMPCNNSSPLALLDQKGDSMANNCQQNDFISYSNKHGEQMFSEYMQKSQGHSVTQSKSSCEEKPLECSGRSERTTESEPGRVKEDIQVTSNCMDMVNSHRKQRGRNTQSEEEYKKQFCDKKVTQNLPPVIPYSIGCQVPQFKPAETQTSASSVPQIIPDLAHTSEKYLGGTGSLRQVYPQVSCMHAGYGYSLHQKPISPSLSNLRLQVERSQPVLVDYHLPEDASNQQQHVRRPFEIPVRLPIMTQKEKIEKLRWCQQMQARLAVEHQQQKFGAWNASMDYSLGNKQPQKIQCHHATVEPKEGDQKILQTKEELDSLTWQENSSIDSGQTYDDDDDGSVEATVLRQLLNMMTQLDIKTRLCIRDALYRLASNAMQRHCVGDTNSSSGNNSEQIGAGGTGTSISSKQAQSYRCIQMTDVETETNPIDRSIAHLLFHKYSMSSEAPANVSAGSGDSIFSTNSQCPTATPIPWFCPIPAFESQTWLGTNQKDGMQITVPCQSLTSIPDSGIGGLTQNVIDVKGSYSGGSCSTSAALFYPRLCSPLASTDFQNGQGINPAPEKQGVQQKNDTTFPDVKCNPLAERDGILDKNEDLSSQPRCKNLHGQLSVKESEIYLPSVGNVVKMGTL